MRLQADACSGVSPERRHRAHRKVRRFHEPPLQAVGFFALAVWGLLSIARGSDQNEVLAQVERLEQAGHFREAAAVLTHGLAPPAHPPAESKQLVFELDRLERIRRDFPYTQEQLYRDLRKSVRDLTRVEYEQWVSEG